MSPPKINAEQRNALYDSVVTHLSGIEDLYLAIESEDFERADRLGREFSDDLLLILDGLGWGKTGTDVELATQPVTLRRVLQRVRTVAEAEDLDEARWREQAACFQRRNRLVRETCTRVLAEIGTSSA